MKLSSLGLSVLFIFSTARASIPTLESDLIAEAVAQANAVACSVRDVSEQILQGENIVPRRLYHWGKKPYLLSNARINGISQEDWDQYIVGEKTRYSLRPSRRGLYGTAGLDTNTFGSNSYNWLMEIRIKAECTEPSRVITYYGLPDDLRFKDWYSSHETSYTFKQFINTCYNHNDPLMNLNGFIDEKCDSIITRFLKDSKVGVVQDQIIKRSFYIVDRDCIEGIIASPSHWSFLLPRELHLWSNHCGSSHATVLPGFLTQVLANSPEPLTHTDAVMLKEQIAKFNYISADSLNAVVDAKVRCDNQQSNKFTNTVKKIFGDNIAIKSKSALFTRLCN